MNTPPRPQQPPHEAPSRPAGLVPIPVGKLTFTSQRQLPGRGHQSVITAKDKDGARVTIDFEPWQRHHRVREFARGGELVVEYCIHETHCDYEPLEAPQIRR